MPGSSCGAGFCFPEEILFGRPFTAPRGSTLENIVVLLLQFPFLLTFCEQAWSGFMPWVVIEQKGSKATPDAVVFDGLHCEGRALFRVPTRERIPPMFSCTLSVRRVHHLDLFTGTFVHEAGSVQRRLLSRRKQEGWSQGREWVSGLPWQVCGKGGNFCDVS